MQIIVSNLPILELVSAIMCGHETESIISVSPYKTAFIPSTSNEFEQILPRCLKLTSIDRRRHSPFLSISLFLFRSLCGAPWTAYPLAQRNMMPFCRTHRFSPFSDRRMQTEILLCPNQRMTARRCVGTLLFCTFL